MLIRTMRFLEKGFFLKTERETSLQAWLCEQFLQDFIALEALSGDAGFRCYYRFSIQDKSYIAVDAPKDKSNNQAFICIQQMLANVQVPVPQVEYVDLARGFFCLSDLGECLLSDVVALNPRQYYHKAIELLPAIATANSESDATIPHYDEALLRLEVSLFQEWLLNTHLNLFLSSSEITALNKAFDVLIENALEQPQVFVHRDYHSRNIMKLEDDALAVIDFQDAVIGPVTYDIVSLLRDCYVRWPEAEVDFLFAVFIESIKANKTLELDAIPMTTWRRWFDLMGVQRHLKASGIFARLHYRDGKSHYLADIPLTLSYLVDICADYPELAIIHDVVKNKVLPATLALSSSN